MAVPASIRAVERPSNTIIEDNGRDGPNRYAVRLRAGVKYVPGRQSAAQERKGNRPHR